jgi:hypothetical protein
MGAISEALPALEALATLFVPGGQAVIAGLTLAQAFGIVNGLVAAEPQIVAAVAAVKNWASGGPPPSPEQWAALDVAYDSASARLAADDALVEAGKPVA